MLPHWQILIAIGAILIISEIVVPGFVMLPIGIGFVLAAGVSALTPNWAIILASLAAFEVAIFWVFQRYLKKFHARTRSYTNAEGMIGAECVVTETIPKGGTGYVKLYGDLWPAKCPSGGTHAVGNRMVIVKTEGNKVHVEPLV
jgi:membrane protein implicated in regulation of membrane protease activity